VFGISVFPTCLIHTSISGIVILFCAALGDAFSGPSAALLTAEVPAVQPIILSVWRFTITGLIFLPFFLLQLVQGDAIAKQVCAAVTITITVCVMLSHCATSVHVLVLPLLMLL
jgi:hypothetical protein